MIRRRSWLFEVGLYLVIVAACVALVSALVSVGEARFGGAAPSRTAVHSDGGPAVHAASAQWAGSPLAVMMLQLLVIVVAAHAFAGVTSVLHQPPVIGELAAGVVLGPTAFGQLFPEASAALFPAASMQSLGLIGQVGVVMFMFTIGLEVNTAELRRQARSAVAISHSSIVVPFVLGVLVAFALFRQYAPPQVPFGAFALFMGVAMSITAFPVLARILEEQRLTRTALGSTALGCAAVDDITAWTLLAIVVALVTAGSGAAFASMLVSIAVFVLVMTYLVRPIVRRWLERARPSRAYHGLAVPLGIALAAALATEMIGVHALFGAFIAGAVMPAAPALRDDLRERISSFAGAVLLPVFFAFTGLRTEIGLLDEAGEWLACAAVVLVAIAGKLCGAMFAARWTGFHWRDAIAIGLLMNTRGLMELVALNIGYDLGVLSPTMFTIMVVMALTTTAMTSPLLDLVRTSGVRTGEPARASVSGSSWS